MRPRQMSLELRGKEAQWKERVGGGGSLTPGIQGTGAALWGRKESRAEVSQVRHWQVPTVQSHKSLVQWEDGLCGKVLVT